MDKLISADKAREATARYKEEAKQKEWKAIKDKIEEGIKNANYTTKPFILFNENFDEFNQKLLEHGYTLEKSYIGYIVSWERNQ